MTAFLGYGLFINAKGVKHILMKLCSIRFLKKWQKNAIETGDDLIISSKELQGKNTRFWLENIALTAVSWSARYFIASCVILAFFNSSLGDQFIIFSRQFVLWVVMLLPATPGSTGVAELSFSALMCKFAPVALVGTMAFLWRTISYYPYLVLGAIVLPRWARRVYK